MSHQALIVLAGGRLYALASEHVREITTMPPTTRLPGAPPDVRGLANLRGQLFAVLDLAHRVGGLPSGVADADVVVLSVDGKTLGVSVDEVRDVVLLDELAGEVPGSGTVGGLIAGMGHLGEAVVIEVDVRALVRQSLA